MRAWWQSLRVGNGHGIRGLAATYYDHAAKAGDTGLTIRVGITAVGSGIAHAIVQSCRMASLPLYLVGFDSNALAFDAFDCDESHVVPAITEPHYIEHMLRLCAACGIEVLIPGLDADLAILAIHAGRFRALGTTPLVGGPEFVRLCRDKLAWSRELNPVCPAIVPAWTAAEAAALHKTGQLALPLLAKPAHGSGSASITVVSNPDDLTSLVNTDIVQPFILPPPQDPAAAAIRDAIARGELLQAGEVSLQLVFAKNGRLLGRMATRNRLKQGIPVEVIPTDDEPLWTALRPAIDHLLARGLWGPVNFQGRVTESGPRFFEMNGRFTGITALRAMIGFNEVQAVLEDLFDVPAARRRSLKANRRRVGMRQVVDRVVDVSAVPQDLPRPPGPRAQRKRLAVVVTGASGWLGRHLVRALLGDVAVPQVTALVRDVARAQKLWTPSERLQIALASDPGALVDAVAGADLVYDIAFARSGAVGELADSLAFTRRLISAAIRAYLPGFVFVSSEAVYGFSHPTPWGECLPPAPETPYATAKLAGEELTALLKEASPSSWVTCVRLGRLYGAADGLRWTEVPHSFAAQSVSGQPIVIRGRDQVLDLLHIRDAIAALVRLAAVERKPLFPVYNVGGGAPASLLEIAQCAVEAARRLGRNATEVRVEQVDGAPSRSGLDIGRFRDDCGWVPSVGLRQGMDELASLALRECPAQVGTSSAPSRS